jgi:hypothetical protein
LATRFSQIRGPDAPTPFEKSEVELGLPGRPDAHPLNRVRQLHTPQEMAILGARGRLQTKRPIDMHPGTMAARDRYQIGEAIERADVEVAGLQ